MDNGKKHYKLTHSYTGAFGIYDLAPFKMSAFYSNESSAL